MPFDFLLGRHFSLHAKKELERVIWTETPSSYVTSPFPFWDQALFKRHIEIMRIALAKKYSSYVMKAQSLYHSVTEKRKMAIFAPSTEKESWEKSSNIWLLTLQCVDSSQSWCFQSIYHLPKCNNENLEQSLQEVRTSGRQRSRTLKEVSLGKETTCFIFFPSHLHHHPLPPNEKPAEGEHDFISSHLSMPTLLFNFLVSYP